MKYQHTAPVFDYKALRLLLGIIAFAMPWLVTAIAQSPLASISASYFTEARDSFVGLLFVVGALMWAYNGHTSSESLASKLASLAALCVALFPTTTKCAESTLSSNIHGGSAVLLFSILAYFCFGPFRTNTKGQGGKKGARAKLYFLCGSIMIICMLVGLVGKLRLSCDVIAAYNLIYWVEAVALGAFGAAWIVSGKIIPIIADEEEALKLFKR